MNLRPDERAKYEENHPGHSHAFSGWYKESDVHGRTFIVNKDAESRG
jgi:hypothetical protein